VSDPSPFISRRGALLGLGSIGLLLGCSSGATKTAAGASRSAAASHSGTAVRGQTVVLGGPHVAAAGQVSKSDVSRFGPLANGQWKGGWRDTKGGSGTSDVTIAINPLTLKAKATVDFQGPILDGAALAPVTYDVDLLSYAKDAASWSLHSPQLGDVTATADGGVSLTGTCTDVPRHSDIANIAVKGTRLGGRVDGRYTITKKDGSVTTGTIAWGHGTTRAQPHDPTDTAQNSIADILSGDYAASFGTAQLLTAAMGRPMQAALANGGRIFFAPGIDVSNARALTAGGNLVVQYSVYRGSVADVAKFWQQNYPHADPIPGPWTQAVVSNGVPPLYAYSDGRVLQISVGPTVNAKGASPGFDELKNLTLSLGKLLMPQLNKR
jgi:hypothetical protein